MLEAEVIGPGKLLSGPMSGSCYPTAFPKGTAIGQHLRVERLLRASSGRMLYLINNLGPKWNRRKCWSCGNRYSPNQAQACTYCATPLRDLRFLMTARWHREAFPQWEAWIRARHDIQGMVRPVAILYRNDVMLTVYHYNGEGLLLDEPAPLAPRRVTWMAGQLADSLEAIHHSGALLDPFGPSNVVMMPDGSPRWFDLGILDNLAGGIRALRHHPERPQRRDVRSLASMLLRYCAPDDTDLIRFLSGAAAGTYADARSFKAAIYRLFASFDTDRKPTPASAYSDTGLVRTNNEDDWAWRRLSEHAVLYVLADGMGGHDAGELASNVAVTKVCDMLEQANGAGNVDEVAKNLRMAFLAANDEVAATASTSGLKMGTTLCAAVLLSKDEPTLVVANAGDSRAYLHRDRKLHQITRDHTVVAELLEDGIITAEQAEHHPASHVLTTTIGSEETLNFDVFKVKIRRGDRMMLCSDGLWGHVSNDRMNTILAEHDDRRTAIQALIRDAYHDGGSDNVTVQLIDMPS